ncbi:hypothetical protein F5Y19DRAFT_245054 [Xylariaceae sp. FL1651]|nr:hypothetical protein F5Y19DRAFT_245054 [Xylariaceae sp. FL1651]
MTGKQNERPMPPAPSPHNKPSMLPPPVPYLFPGWPRPNIVLTVYGQFSPGSPLHNFITGPYYEGKDWTETRLVNAIRDILRDPTFENKPNLDWKPHPEKSSHYLRVDASIWIGMPTAPGNWDLDLPDGWSQAPLGVMKHVGHPDLCRLGHIPTIAHNDEHIDKKARRGGATKGRPRGSGSRGRAPSTGRGGRGRRATELDHWAPGPLNPSIQDFGFAAELDDKFLAAGTTPGNVMPIFAPDLTAKSDDLMGSTQDPQPSDEEWLSLVDLPKDDS